MSIQKKTLLIVLFCVIGIIGVVYTISDVIVTDSFQELEYKHARENTRRVFEVLMNELDHLSTFVEEYSAWDKTYEFVEQFNEKYIKEDLARESLVTEHYNMVALYDNDGELVYGRFYEPGVPGTQKLPLSWQQKMSPKHPLFIPRDERGRTGGLIKMDDGRALLVKSNPIRNSFAKGKPQGTAIIGRLFDSDELQRLARVSKMSLRLLDFDQVSKDGRDSSFYKALTVNAPFQLRILDEQTIHGFLLLKDVHSKPAYVVEVSLPRDIYHQGQATLNYYTKLLLIVGIVTILIVLLLMNQLVLLRLKRLGTGMKKVHETGDLGLHIDIDGNDEFRYLADVFNELMDSLRLSQIELEQQINERTEIEQEIRKAQELYNQAEILGKLGYWERDYNKDLLISCSEQFAQMYDMSIDDALVKLSKNEGELEYIHEDDRDIVKNKVTEANVQKKRLDVEYRIRASTGQIRHVHKIGEYIHDESGASSRCVGTLQDITRQKETQQKLELYQSKLRSLMSELALVEEQERRRISIELHDSTIQNLGLSKFKLAVFKNSLPKDISTEIVDEIISTLEKAIKDTRSLVFELSPPILYELGFVPAIEWLAEQVYLQRSLVCEVYDDGQVKKLDDSVMIMLFQIVRELLVNISKHANAKKATILIDRKDEKMRIQVIDDGKGFENKGEESIVNLQGYGLFSIRERLSNLGETLHVESSHEKGTHISFSAPIIDNERAVS